MRCSAERPYNPNRSRSPRTIFTTHQHYDHWQALADVAATTGAPTAAGRIDAPELPVAPDILLDDGDVQWAVEPEPHLLRRVAQVRFDVVDLAGVDQAAHRRVGVVRQAGGDSLRLREDTVGVGRGRGTRPQPDAEVLAPRVRLRDARGQRRRQHGTWRRTRGRRRRAGAAVPGGGGALGLDPGKLGLGIDHIEGSGEPLTECLVTQPHVLLGQRLGQGGGTGRIVRGIDEHRRRAADPFQPARTGHRRESGTYRVDIELTLRTGPEERLHRGDRERRVVALMRAVQRQVEIVVRAGEAAHRDEAAADSRGAATGSAGPDAGASEASETGEDLTIESPDPEGPADQSAESSPAAGSGVPGPAAGPARPSRATDVKADQRPGWPSSPRAWS